MPSAPSASASAPAAASTAWSPVAHPLAWLLALAVVHVVARVVISPALKWDEAEQMLWSQHLAWGYGAQPPLYTWLQWAVNAVVGPNVLALALLKHALLALAFVLMWLAGRELLGPRGAWFASASMWLLPPLGWDLVSDKTHTVLVVAMSCGAWWLLLRIVRRPRPADFAWLGLVCGLGMLSKYSFALVIGAMLAAALSVAEARRALLSRGWWWALVVGALVVLPHAVWLASHLREATTDPLVKMQIEAEAQPIQGVLSLLKVWGTTLALWLLIGLWAFGRACWRAPLTPAASWAPRLFGRYLLLVPLALLGLVLFAGVTHFKTHWAAPLLCVAPLAAFAARPELTAHPRAGRYAGVVAALALVVLAAAAVRPWVSGARGNVGELNHPLLALESALREAGYDGRGRIIAADHMLGGMLRTRFPRAEVDDCMARREDVPACVTLNIASARQGGVGWLLVSRDDRVEEGWWEQAAVAVPGLTVRLIERPFNMARAGAPPARYRYSWHPAEKGTAP
jgi:4-amino-4-deoxy-L-arabinose transferase-like glycosyltransferase